MAGLLPKGLPTLGASGAHLRNVVYDYTMKRTSA